MSLEIRILSGSYAGQVKRFDQSVVVVGRQGGLDMRFDPQADLDVSGRHAEFRTTEHGYVLTDLGSTNGTFVNGKRITGPTPLSEADTVRFGANGPEAQVHFSHEGVAMMRAPLRSTEQRIAIAVTEQTAGLKKAMIAAVVLIVVAGGATAGYFYRQSATRTEEFNRILADNERMRSEIGTRIGAADTALTNEIQRKLKSLQDRLSAAKTDAERATITAEISENQQQLRRMVQMDLQTLFRTNSPAVAILMTEMVNGKDTSRFSGSGFSISKQGHIITNRHNVRVDGKTLSRIAVKFTDTPLWLPASLVKVSDSDDDIALIKMDREDDYPVVAGVAANGTDAVEGTSVAAIGYPLGNDLPQEGDKDFNTFIAKASLNPGIVSKKTSSVLQIDSYATHGSSGSPVFSARGQVIGLIYGGAREAGGKIVYAVPPEKIAAFIPAELKGIIKP
jgi:S1-C subfamily serine protease